METKTRIELGRRDLLAWDAERPKTYFDPHLQRVLQHRLGRDRYEAEKRSFETAGEVAATDMARLGRETNLDENLPRLERFSGLGVRTEEIVFHPSYHEVGRLIWETGVLARYREPGQETTQLAINYMICENGELGHACPLACTAGLIKVLQAVATKEQKERWLPGLLSTSYRDRIHASQFLTEVQGGSDVGANAVIAEPLPGGQFAIRGEKWFCSVADAQVFLMTARPSGAPEGTKGLGLFIVPRRVGDGVNEFYIRRLKRKLGTRAMASGEIDFMGARAESVGPLDRGFKNVVERVLDTSRVYNAVSCAASMRRVYAEAAGFARRRRAFGETIDRFPLVRESLATLNAEAIAATSATFRLVAEGDRLSKDETKIAARRVGVNVNKYWTSVRNTQMVRLAMEVFGGNGTIESFSIIPQLYRDAMVLESWEGTHNVLVQQVLRDAERLKLHEAFAAELEESLARTKSPENEVVDRLRASIRNTKSLLDRAGEIDQRYGRRIIDQLAIQQACVAMIEELASAPDDRTKRGALRLIAERDLVTELAPPRAVDEALI